MESQQYIDLSLAREKVKGFELRNELFRMIEDAADNAADTCNEKGLKGETAARAVEWAEVFTNTLVSITTYRETTSAARRWFARRGVVG